MVFTILFGVLLRTPSRTATGDQPYAIFLFAGLVPWTFFASSLQGGAASVVANGAIVKRVRMPVQLLPAASVLSALVNLVASTAVLLAVLAVFGPRHPEGLLWLPLLVAVQLVLGLGFAYVLAALNVFFRDVEHILSVILLAWYFLTPVLFPVSILADRPRELALLHLNPMTAIVVGWQRALLDGAPPEWDALAYAAAFGIVLFVAGVLPARQGRVRGGALRAALALLAGFAILAAIVATGALDTLDQALLALVQVPRSAALDLLANLVTAAGQAEVTGTLAIGMALARLRHRRIDWWEPLGLFVVTIIEVTAKMLVPQPLPPRELSRSVPLAPFLTLPLRGAFPSGHVTRFAYLSGLFGVIPLWVRVGFLAVAIATRVYLAEHWPSDTLGGLLLGVGGALVAGAIATRMKRRRPGDAEGAR